MKMYGASEAPQFVFKYLKETSFDYVARSVAWLITLGGGG
jgi:hypothetical protein